MDRVSIAKALANMFIDLLPNYSTSMLGYHPAFMVRSNNVTLASITVHVHEQKVVVWGHEPSARTLEAGGDGTNGDKFEVALADPNAIPMIVNKACEFLKIKRPAPERLAEAINATR